MTARDDQFSQNLVAKLSEAARQFVRPKIPSRTLAAALSVFGVNASRGGIWIPHYWAVFVHDGRGPFGPVVKQFLVWFRDKHDDPRLQNGVAPERVKDIKRLTKEQYHYGLQRNRAARKVGAPPYMIVTERVTTPTQATNFFLNGPGGGMYGFKEIAEQIGQEETSKYAKRELRDILDLRGSTTVRV